MSLLYLLNINYLIYWTKWPTDNSNPLMLSRAVNRVNCEHHYYFTIDYQATDLIGKRRIDAIDFFLRIACILWCKNNHKHSFVLINRNSTVQPQNSWPMKDNLIMKERSISHAPLRSWKSTTNNCLNISKTVGICYVHTKGQKCMFVNYLHKKGSW